MVGSLRPEYTSGAATYIGLEAQDKKSVTSRQDRADSPEQGFRCSDRETVTQFTPERLEVASHISWFHQQRPLQREAGSCRLNAGNRGNITVGESAITAQQINAGITVQHSE